MNLTQILQKLRSYLYTKKEIDSMGGGTSLSSTLNSKANKSDLSAVATSGSYNDLTNKPTIPTVNNATLTIQKNGTTVKTFTANASSNVTCNITVPTKISDLTNDSGFVIDVSGKADKATTLSGYGITDAYTKTQVDKKVSDLVNSAPETLDTLNELASALGNDPNFATTVSTEIGKKLDTTTASSTYIAKGDGIVGLSVSGKVITYTKGDGSTGTITTRDTNTWTAFKGATSSANGTAGYVPAPTKGNQDKFFKADGTWAVPTNTTYSFSNSAPTLAWGTTSTIGTVGGVDLTVTMPANPNTDTHWTTTLYAGAKDAKSNAVTTNGNSYIKLYDNNTVRSQLNIKGSGATTVTTDANGVITISSTDNNTTYSVATTSANGLMSKDDKTKLDGLSNYTLPTAGSKLGGVKTTSTVTSTSGLTACPIISGVPYYKDTNTTYSAMSATEATTGTATSARSITAKVLHDKISEMLPTKAIVGITRSGTTFTYTCVDGTTGTFTQQDNNTTYSNMTAATASAAGKAGLVPAPGAGKQTSFLRGDGTWVVPTNTTYSVATTSANGLLSAADKTKLDGLSNYTLPTGAKDVLGGVKTTSTVTSTSGLTACPIISGVVYYKDSNTDTKVTNTLGNTTKAYITGTTSATTNTGTQIFDSGVYLTTTAGQLHADIDFPITEAEVNEILGID